MIANSLNKNIDDEWKNFISDDYEEDTAAECESQQLNTYNENKNIEVPIASKIYISTKSKIAYLNQHIDLKALFWGIKI